MIEDGQKKNEIPRRMSRIAFPKAKYGIYFALIIIFIVLLILYKDLILQIIYFMAKDLSKIAKQKKIKYFLISFVDLFGVLRSKLVPTEAIKDM